MSTKAETKKDVLINLRISRSIKDELARLGVNLSDTARKAFEVEVKRLLIIDAKNAKSCRKK